MAFFPHDTTKFRPAKLIVRADPLREADRAIQEGLGGYENRHELVNDAIEQLLVDLRYGKEDQLALPEPKSDKTASVKAGEGARPARSKPPAATNGGEPGDPPVPGLDDVEPIADLAETAIVAPTSRGVSIENEIADIQDVPQLGLHNRDAPSIFALAILADRAHSGPVPMRAFYEDATAEAWKLAAALEPWELEHKDKVTVMLPRNRAKPQTAAEGFEFFGIGQVNRRPDANGRLTTFGPFFQWNVAGLVRDAEGVKIGMTEAGWELLEALEGLDFSLPHDEAHAQRFLVHLNKYSKADLWGFRELLNAVAGDIGREALREHFRTRLTADYLTDKPATEAVAESTAQGYLSRTRAWGMVAPKMADRRYSLTDFGAAILDDINNGNLDVTTGTAA